MYCGWFLALTSKNKDTETHNAINARLYFWTLVTLFTLLIFLKN